MGCINYRNGNMPEGKQGKIEIVKEQPAKLVLLKEE